MFDWLPLRRNPSKTPVTSGCPGVLLHLSLSPCALFTKGFRERSHRGLLAALRLLYTDRSISTLLEDFEEAMRLREEADYGLIYSEESARTIVESASNFLAKTRKILKPLTTRQIVEKPRYRKGKKP